MFVFKDLEASIMQLNGEFELQLTIVERIEDKGKGEGVGSLTLMSDNQMRILKVFGSGIREKAWTSFCHSINVASCPCHSIPISYYTKCQPIR